MNTDLIIDISRVFLFLSASSASLYLIYFLRQVLKSITKIEEETVRLTESAIPALNSLQDTTNRINLVLDEIDSLTSQIKIGTNYIFDKSVFVVDEAFGILNNVRNVTNIINVEKLLDFISEIKKDFVLSLLTNKTKSIKAFKIGFATFWRKLKN